MKLVQLKCPSCGAKIDGELGKKVKCSFCNIPIYIDDEVMRVEHNIKNIDKEEKIKSIDAFIKFNDYENATNVCKELSIKHPYEPWVWYQLLICLTRNFTRTIEDEENLKQVISEFDSCYDRYIVLETDDNNKKATMIKYEEYKKMIIGKYKKQLRNKVLVIISFILLVIIMVLTNS